MFFTNPNKVCTILESNCGFFVGLTINKAFMEGKCLLPLKANISIFKKRVISDNVMHYQIIIVL